MKVHHLPEKVVTVAIYDDLATATHRQIYPISNCRAIQDCNLVTIVPEDIDQLVIFWEQHRQQETLTKNYVYVASYAPNDKSELYRYNETETDGLYERWSNWWQRWAEETPPEILRGAIVEAYTRLVIELA